MLSTVLLSLLLAPAQAASNEIDFELGTFGAPDANWALFSSHGAVSTWGVRGGVAFGDHTTVVLSWQHSWDGGSTDGVIDDYSLTSAYSSWNLAMATNQFAVGPKFDLEIFPWLHPYGTVQALAWLGTVTMDDDTSDDQNLNQLARTGIAPGGIAAVGIDLIPFRSDLKVRPATYVEAGYGYALPMKISDLGSIQFDGFYLHWGIGARF